MSTTFLLQRTGCFLDELPTTVRETIEAVNLWDSQGPQYNGVKQYSYRVSTLDNILYNSVDTKDVIPVGSVEFCTAVAAAQGCPVITAINVPAELRSEEFTGRNVFTAEDISDLKRLLKLYPSLLVKPADQAKRFDALYVSEKLIDITLKDVPGPYFASELLDKEIIAEWRIFFHRGKIVTARPYLLPVWSAPDRQFAEDMLYTWQNAPSAGTMDIAVLEGGQNVLLEAHQFIACGLYGFEEPEVLQMLQDAWRWQINQPT